LHDLLIAIDPDLDRAIAMLCSGCLGHA